MRQFVQHRSTKQNTHNVTASVGSVEDALPSAFLAILVVFPVLFNAAMLWPELLAGAPTRNDSAFHLLMIKGASDALARGQNPFDFWIPQLELGFPQFLYYQHFPHLVVVGIHRLLFGAVPLETIYNVSRFLLLTALPLTVYWSMRRMGFAIAAAAFGALASSLLSTDAQYGFEYNSYIWRGFGMYAQLWGMHLTFIALACLHYSLRLGRGYAAAIAALAALALSHLLLAYMMSITGVLVLISLSDRRSIRMHFARVAAIGISAGVVASYMLIPFVMSSGSYLSRRPDVAGSGRQSSSTFFDALMGGDLFDYGRLPVLSALVVAGVVVAIARFKRDENRVHRLALGGLFVWLVLLVGNPAVGPLAKLLPTHSGYVTSRFISAVDAFAILIIGVGGAWLWEVFGRLRSRTRAVSQPGKRLLATASPLIALSSVLVLFAPAVAERARYYAVNRELMSQTRDAMEANTEINEMLHLVTQQSGGRLYAGMRQNWGAQMRISSSVSVAEVVRFLGIPAVGAPYQSLSLNGSLLPEFREGDEALFDILDIRWVITPAGATVPHFYQPYHRTTHYALYRVRTSGLAQYVSVYERRSANSEAELYQGNRAWFVLDKMNTRQFIRWDYKTRPTDFEPTERCADGGKIGGEQAAAGKVHLEAECAMASTLLLKMTYHPNWQVTVDGNRVETTMLSPSLIGVDLPAGRHVIDAAYVATSTKIPLVLVGLAVLIAWIVFRNRLPSILVTPTAPEPQS